MTIDGVVAGPVLELWALVGALLGTLLLLAGTLWAGERVAGQVRAIWRAVRRSRPTVIGALDEPSDALIRRLEAATGVPAEVWIALLPALLEALADGLDRALVEQQTAVSGR